MAGLSVLVKQLHNEKLLKIEFRKRIWANGFCMSRNVSCKEFVQIFLYHLTLIFYYLPFRIKILLWKKVWKSLMELKKIDDIHYEMLT